MPKDDLVSRVVSLFAPKGPSAKQIAFVHVRDPLANFEIDIPKGWTFDEYIAVESGTYSISFESGDGRNRFVVSVNTRPPSKDRFEEHVRKECEGPSSGIICPMAKTRYKGYHAFGRTIRIGMGKDAIMRSDLIFLAKSAVYWISADLRHGDMDRMEPLRKRMLDSFIVRQTRV